MEESIRIAVLGNVDSGKSTTISVLKNNILDNGRGSARIKVFKHKHEAESGRTSSLNHTHIKKDSKLITYVDLAGHEKYLKTTVFGLNACSIDYVLILVGANMGVQRMTREHFKIAISLNLPIIFVITKIDICPNNILDQTIENIKKLISLGYKKHPKKALIIDSNESYSTSLNFYKEHNIPIFKISNNTGENLFYLKNFINNLSLLVNYENKIDEEPLFMIEETFFVNGVGCVVSGVVKQGKINVGDKFFIGPFNGLFKSMIVKSMHDNFRNNIKTLKAGMSGCICIKSNKKDNIKKKNIKKGMVLTSEAFNIENKATIKFAADVLILHHPTTIKTNYSPVVHCGNITQSARIYEINKELVRTGDRAKIKFEFMNRPEFIRVGSRIIFREGKAKGIGKVIEVY